MAILEQKYRVNMSHIGVTNEITNIGILSMLEEIACFHSDKVSFGLNDIPTTHLSWILLAWKVKVLKRVIYGSIITVRTWAKCSNKFNTYRDFEIIDENGEIVCIATSKWALIDTEKESIVHITDDIINNYLPEEKNVFENGEIEKLIEPTTHHHEYTYTTQRRDIDINKHMHNLYYLSLAYEVLPQEIYEAKEFNNIEIMYKKGIRLGDTVKFLYTFEHPSHIIAIKSQDEKVLHAIVKLY